MGRLILGAAALLALLAGIYCLVRVVPVSGPAREDACAPRPETAAGRASVLASHASSQAGRTNSAVVEFASWAKKYFEAASAGEREALLAEGEELAKARLAEMYELIKRDPKQALAEAISYDDRKRLPQSIVSLLEQPVNGKGDYYVLGAVAAPGGAKPEKTIQRKALVNGKTYDAYVYGWRLHQVTREGMSFNAIGVPPRNPGERPRLAVGEPVRTLSALEAKDAIAS
ncbi:MAG TPA: hypothetical protein VK850_06045, partial [Candidatus Binatia bacterium]|nr:hypothetical protein [Candidatus Binatia bacterium]